MTPRSLDATRSPRYARLLAIMIVVMLIVMGLILVFVPWQQTAFGSGQVVAYAPVNRQQTVDAPIEGRVVEWYVREGSRVQPGDPIVRLTDYDPEILERLRQERRALEARLEAARQRAAAIGDRIAQLRVSRENALSAAQARAQMGAERLEAARQAVSAARERVETARLNLERQEALFARGLTAERQAELARLEYAQAVTELRRAEASLEAARAEVGGLEAEQRRAGAEVGASINDALASQASAEAEVAGVQAELTRIEGRLARQRAQNVEATREGTIMRLVVGEGNVIVKAGDPLAVLVPELDVRAVEVWVRGQDAPLLAEGQEARVQIEGWPALQLLGWPSVAVGTFPGRVVVVDPAANERGQVRVLMVPDPPDAWPSSRYLRQGMQARAWVLLNQVPLGFELWRQFNGFPPGIGPGGGTAVSEDVIDLKTRK